jgi:hypothetical protein
VAALAGATVAEPAQSQVVVPTNEPAAVFARCVVKRDPAAARAAVMTMAGSAEEPAALRGLIRRGDNCLRTNFTLTMQGPVLRGAVAEALIFLEPGYATRLAALPSRAPERPAAGAPVFGEAVAQCVAQAEPSQSFAVLKTKLNSVDERTAVFKLKPIIDGCLPAEGQQELRVDDLRTHLASALAQLAVRVASDQAGVR